MEEAEEGRVLDVGTSIAEETSTSDKDGEISRVYGKIDDDKIKGISIYIEPSELSDVTKLSFKV